MIERYLVAHPDFFERHTDLLETLKIPHASGATIFLVERQVQALLARNRQLECKLTELVQIARDNEVLSSRLHRLALGLMEAEGLNDVIAITKDLLRTEFPSMQVVLKLIKNPRTALQAKTHILSDDPPASLSDGLFIDRRPMCGLLNQACGHCMFEREAPDIAAAVMVPLIDSKRLGVPALGSVDKERFHTGMGTLFLGYLGKLVSKAVIAHISR